MQAAHIRNLLDVGVAPGKYDMHRESFNPLRHVVRMYDFQLWQEDGEGGGSFFSHAAAQLEYATASAYHLNPQASTFNLQPSTLNPQPSTLNPQPSTLNLQP